jgi:pyridoxal phosphate enzyme (YggS family)
MHTSIQHALQSIRNRIAKAEEHAGRPAGSVTLLPISKTFGESTIRAAVSLGLDRLGENKVQEIRAKFSLLEDCHIRWVMVGHLQTNKAKDIAQMADEVQSLDRIELAKALHKRLESLDRTLKVLVQIKTSPEPSKYGMDPVELIPFLRFLSQETPRLQVEGLMTLAIHEDDPNLVRPCFRVLRELRDQAQQEGIPNISLHRLSMGMSNDFEIAIEEGSTEVRIGTSLFGSRGDQYHDYWPEPQQ